MQKKIYIDINGLHFISFILFLIILELKTMIKILNSYSLIRLYDFYTLAFDIK